jgi:hypothetical protein
MVVEGRAKGSLFLHSRRFVGGEEAWNRLLTSIDEPHRRALSEPFASNVWYPVVLWNRLMDAYLASAGGPKVMELARFVAAEDLNFVFKMLLKMGSPEFVLKRVESIYQRYFDSGAMTASEAGPRHWRVMLDGEADALAAPSAVVCGFGVPGWLTEALIRTGASGVRVAHSRCRYKGAPRCEFVVTW